MSKILIFSWKDIRHPKAGGAEIVTHQIAKRLVTEGHSVTLLTARFPHSGEFETIDGIHIIRCGGSFSHYIQANRYYTKHLKNQFDIIVEQINTIPYFTNLYAGNEKKFLWYHQLAREIWFYEMHFPLNLVGYLAEPIYTWFQSSFNNSVITVSDSSKRDLIKYGFKNKKIHIISEGIENQPLVKYYPEDKEKIFTVMFHSSLRSMKRPSDSIKAFAFFNKDYPESQLWISGGGDQTSLKNLVQKLGISDNVIFWGRTTDEQKLNLMKRASILCSTSLKEGWGLIVTEANSMGTPVGVYDVDGLRDAATFSGGYICKANPTSLAYTLKEVYELYVNQPDSYNKLCEKAISQSKLATFEQSFIDFKHILSL